MVSRVKKIDEILWKMYIVHGVCWAVRTYYVQYSTAGPTVPEGVGDRCAIVPPDFSRNGRKACAIKWNTITTFVSPLLQTITKYLPPNILRPSYGPVSYNYIQSRDKLTIRVSVTTKASALFNNYSARRCVLTRLLQMWG